YPAFPSSAKVKSVDKRVGFSLPDRSLLRHHHRGYGKAVALDGLVSSHPVKELIPQRFYFTVVDGFPVINPSVKRRPILLNIDDELVYDRFYRDFGPLNLAQITIYLRKVKSLLESGARDDRPVVHYCCSRPEKRSNAILLASAYLMVFHNLPPAEALERVEAGYPPVVPFRDASVGDCPYPCTILDCLCGLEYAHSVGWYDPRKFDVNEYNYYGSLTNGDVNWIIPGKILAFSSPHDERRDPRGYPVRIPEDYHAMFHSMGVKLIIRLNQKLYDRSRFTSAGFAHMDLFFPDGSCPSPSIVNHFVSAIEAIKPGAVAVHCKAGLGRTGCLIGLYAMRRYGFPARAWIGWNRLCRPGSILGHQQQFLCDTEHSLRASHLRHSQLFPTRIDPANYGEDRGQGERLVAARQEAEIARLIAKRKCINAIRPSVDVMLVVDHVMDRFENQLWRLLILLNLDEEVSMLAFTETNVDTISREAALVRREILARREHESSDNEEINDEMPTRCISHNRAQLDPEGSGLLDAEGRVQNARMLRRKRRMRRAGAKYVTDRQVPDWIKCGSCGAVLESKRQKRASRREVAEVTSKQRIDGLVEAALKENGVKPDEGVTDSVESDEEEFITVTEHEMAVDMLKEECEAKVQEALQLVKERDDELVQITGSEVRWSEACNEARAQRDVTKGRVVSLEARLSDLEANIQLQKEQTTHLEVALAHHEDMDTRHLSRLEVCFEKVHDADLQRRVLESLYCSGQLSRAHKEAVESDARHRERIGGLEREITKLQGENRRRGDNYDRVTLQMRSMAEAKVRRLLRPTTEANRLFAWDAWQRVRPQLRLEMQIRELRRELSEAQELRQVLVGTVALRDKEIAEKASRIGELKIHVKELTQRLEGVEHEHRAHLRRVKDEYHARAVRATDLTFSRLSARWQQYVATKERNWTVLIEFLRRRLSWLAGFIRDESMLREISEELGPSIIAAHLQPKIRVDNMTKEG
ncbi:Dual specificity protein phosphatase cdc14a, partial [Perkinsus olseni]